MTNEQLRAKVCELMASGGLPSDQPVVDGTGPRRWALALPRDGARQTPAICTEPEPTVSYFWTGGWMASLHAAGDVLWKPVQSR